MFIKLGLKNFKCFKEVEVSFSKVTLLTGENSSGKSSLIYGLLIPFQSNGFPLYLFPNGKYVNMGDFEEISFRNGKSNTIEINLHYNFYADINPHIITSWIFNPVNKLPKLKELKTNQSLGDQKINIKSFGINFVDDHYESIFYEEGESRIFEFSYLNEIIDRSSRRFRDNPVFKGSSIDCIINANDMIEALVNEFDHQLNFMGSHRLDPERTYYQKTKLNHKILSSGEGFIDQILEWQEKKSEEFESFITILKDLKLLYDIKPQKLGGGRFDLRVKVNKSSNWASLADVGFGVSQLLPIIVADLQLSNNSTLIMAQPETHLHPSIQAELGTYLVKQINQKEKQYIVETHSEYLINRLRLAIVKGEIEPEDVAVYYFENTVKEGSIAHQIQFTKQGQILNAPQGFFDTYMIDTMDIALNA